jgi:uncharacterized protein with NRDE domain
MCLAVVALDAHPSYALVVAANRDEWHARPAAPAAWWPEGLLAGRDLAAGGTWLGVTRGGRFAFLTNLRDPARHDPAAPTRGTLVPGVLADAGPIAAALAHVRTSTARHNGYNLVAGESLDLVSTSNRHAGVRVLARGVHGVSNGPIDDAWPKTRRMTDRVARWIERRQSDIEPLFAALADRTQAPDSELPSTGVPLERERLLSAIFIRDERYGTRCSTVLAIGRDGVATFVERSFAPDGTSTGEVTETFALQRNGSSMAT